MKFFTPTGNSRAGDVGKINILHSEKRDCIFIENTEKAFDIDSGVVILGCCSQVFKVGSLSPESFYFR